MLCGRVNRDGSPSLRRRAYMVQRFPLRNITLFVYYPFRDQSYTQANLIHTNLIHKGEARQTGIIGARAFASGSRLDTRCESAKSFRPASAWSTRRHSNIGLSVGSNIAHEHRPKSVQGMCALVGPPVAAGYKLTPRSFLGLYIHTYIPSVRVHRTRRRRAQSGIHTHLQSNSEQAIVRIDI